MTLKRTPIRPGGAELVRLISQETSGLPDGNGISSNERARFLTDAQMEAAVTEALSRHPSAAEVPEPPPVDLQEAAAEPMKTTKEHPDTPTPKPRPVRPPSSTATEQINFRGSPELARILARLAVEQGSIRLVIATLLENAGHPVPEVDLAPPPGRRRL
jgi:hypothetical protein